MSGCTRRAVLVLCTTAITLAAAAPAAAERRVYFTIKSVTALYQSEYDIPLAHDPNGSRDDGCPTVYQSERGREVVTLRSTRPVRAEAVYDTRARPRHWRMNSWPYRLPSVQTITREKYAVDEPRYVGNCGPFPQAPTQTYRCGGPEVYTIKRDTGIGPTVGPHTVRNTFEVENWLGTNPAYLPPNHPLDECEVPGGAVREGLRNGMWQIGRGRWKRRTLTLDRTVVYERCIGDRDNTSYFGNPGPPCGPVTTRMAWTVKLVRRPDPRRR